jgi:cyclohexadieny/prephenate dehydrogenase
MSAAAPLFDRMLIVGVGLIGVSIARGAREKGLAGAILGCDRDADVLARATAIGALDAAAPSLADGLKGADLVIVSTPVGAMPGILKEIDAAADAGAIVIDVGSVKGAVCAAAGALSARVHYVPSHPVAGTERSGPEAGFASLFEGRWTILTPLARTDEAYRAAVAKVGDFWRMLGSRVEVMDADHHDLALAVTSHLPHLIAFTLVCAADDVETVAEAEVVKYSAGGFRDFTRIAASDPVMWRDVFLNNREAVLEVLGRFSEELAVLQRAIRWGDGEALLTAFARGRELRQAIVKAGQEKDVANFGRDEKD